MSTFEFWLPALRFINLKQIFCWLWSSWDFLSVRYYQNMSDVIKVLRYCSDFWRDCLCLCVSVILCDCLCYLWTNCLVVWFRGLSGGGYPNSTPSEPHPGEGKITEETVICHSKPASLSSTESSDGGKKEVFWKINDI